MPPPVLPSAEVGFRSIETAGAGPPLNECGCLRCRLHQRQAVRPPSCGPASAGRAPPSFPGRDDEQDLAGRRARSLDGLGPKGRCSNSASSRRAASVLLAGDPVLVAVESAVEVVEPVVPIEVRDWHACGVVVGAYLPDAVPVLRVHRGAVRERALASRTRPNLRCDEPLRLLDRNLTTARFRLISSPGKKTKRPAVLAFSL